jgi:hypothetical protein
MEKNNSGSNSDSEIQKSRKELQARAIGINLMFKQEFSEKLHANKLMLKFVSCNKGCNGCPHGPYWHRAVFNPKIRKWGFRFVKANINKGLLLSKEEREKWDRYRFYNEELRKLRAEKRKLRGKGR